MNFSNKLDLDRYFSELSAEVYCIIKLSPDFPNYKAGSDLDIFCYDLEKFSQKLMQIGRTEVEAGFEIRVTTVSKSQVHIDFFLNNVLDLRFDLYQAMPAYKKLSIKPGLFGSIVEQSVSISRNYKGQPYPLFVPSKIDELLLRYFEYAEWYELRPDKIKHLEYIEANVGDNAARITLLDKLHHYTQLPPTVYPAEYEIKAPPAPERKPGPLKKMERWIRKKRKAWFPPR